MNLEIINRGNKPTFMNVRRREEIHTIEELNTAAESLQRAITEAYEATCKLVRGRGKYEVPWWNNGLEKLKKTPKALLKKAVKSNDNRKWIAWRSKQKVYRHAVRKAQTESWREYCRSVEAGKEATRLNKILAHNPEAWLGAVKLPTGKYTESDEETLAHLMESNFPGFIIAGDTCETADEQVETGGEGPRHNSGCRELANLIVSPAKLRWAISSFDSYKSPGEDGILPILIKEGVDTIIEPLVRFRRASIAAGYTPKCWRTAKVVFIPKKGKGSYNTAKDFRPICLTSFMLKTLERLVDRYIKEYILKDNPLCNEQHAYREERSIESALHGAVSLIEEHIKGGGYAVGDFLDTEGAFNNTATDSICKAAKDKGIPLIKWIMNMISNRKLTVTRGNTTAKGSVNNRCPQRGVLSPTLWGMVIDGALWMLTNLGVATVGYADDILVTSIT
ncbi:hypothetical protein TSAR_012297 [Trichomalopsis sarcophagae]|uniref:Reverse transcriptase domain-containing protein n=1 Tax=Trichomalopsis sarcophagae TaxID=543379 RepID=A0A232FNY7_9HYME|nr:hypothetical protein TSAR_012297 [Trichomalopsis sarcophagae]